MVKELEPHKKHKVKKEDNELKKELSDKKAIDDACDNKRVGSQQQRACSYSQQL